MHEDELNALTEKSLAVSFQYRSHYTTSLDICVNPCSSVANCQAPQGCRYTQPNTVAIPNDG
ncbi:hypothetical protein Poly59_55190 [Rubripirellula reticaptiva]|uniref:Uncharacterized protein n=1 Tax=Rubripirellula reticaptiva TaxID=2528013 RepID=A0A5C6EG67_9BACT|nr:hypothetical protein Poly59_55190 [Rubripirellula reticaptiva]